MRACDPATCSVHVSFVTVLQSQYKHFLLNLWEKSTDEKDYFILFCFFFEQLTNNNNNNNAHISISTWWNRWEHTLCPWWLQEAGCVDRVMIREGPPIHPPGQIMLPVCTLTVCIRNAWMSRGGGDWGPPRRSARSSARLWCASPLTLLQGERIFKHSNSKFKLLLNWPCSV